MLARGRSGLLLVLVTSISLLELNLQLKELKGKPVITSSCVHRPYRLQKRTLNLLLCHTTKSLHRKANFVSSSAINH
uniref:Secreted protein n=1 Tax=Steinernema glaseri TaxID=37863 RepID=A0A1I7ZNB9_9BILA